MLKAQWSEWWGGGGRKEEEGKDVGRKYRNINGCVMAHQ